MWPSLYGLLVALALLATAVAEKAIRSDNLVGAAILLAGTWLISNAVASLGIPACAEYFPYMDAACLVWFLWISPGRLWVGALALLFGADCGLHMLYQQGMATAHDYVLTLNVFFFLQLCCVALSAVHQILTSRSRARGHPAPE